MRILFQVLARLPLPLLQGLGNLLGWLLWLLPNSRRRAAYANLALCQPGLTPAQRRRLVRRSLCHEMKTILELAVIWLGGKNHVAPSGRFRGGRAKRDQFDGTARGGDVRGSSRPLVGK